MQPLRLVMTNHLQLDVDDIISLAVKTKEAVLESMKIFNVKIKDEINLDAIENEARQIYAEVARSVPEEDEFMIALMNL